MRRGYLLVVLLFALAVALWLPPAQAALRDWLIVPLLEIVWIGELIFGSIPQGYVWGFLVLLAILAASGGVALGSRFVAAPTRPWATQTGLLAPWARLIAQGANDDYARWRLAQRLALLAQQVLGGNQPLSPSELRRYLVANPPEVPPEVCAYLLAGLSTYLPERRPLGPFALFASQQNGRGSGPLATRPEQVVAFLEGRAG